MSPIGPTILLLGLLAAGDGGEAASVPRGVSFTRYEPVAAEDVPAKKPSDALKKRKLRFTVGVATTYVTGPLDRDGYVDYTAALNDLLRAGTTPANNANVLFWQAFGPRPEGSAMPPEFFKWMGIEEPPERRTYYIDEARFLPLIPVDVLLEQSDAAAARPWTAKDYPHLAAWLKRNAKPLALVVEGTKRSHYFSPLVSFRSKEAPGALIAALVPGVQRCRSLVHTLCIRAMFHLGEGRHDEAWQDLLTCHRLGRHVGSGGTLIEGLVGLAIDRIASGADLTFLAHAKRKPQQLRDCLRDLQRLPPMPSMGKKIDRVERLMGLDLLLRVERSGLRSLAGFFDAAPPVDPDPKVQRMLENLHWDAALRTANRWYDRLADTADIKEPGLRQKQLAQLEKELKTLRSKFGDPMKLRKLLLDGKQTPQARSKLVGDALIAMLLPGTARVYQAGDRVAQVHANLEVAFALAIHQRERGRYPSKLDALAPSYLEEVPQDRFSGRPLIYRPSEKGYLLYSVGINGRDDGGRGYDDDPAGDDLSVRMPLPKLKAR